MTQSLYVCAGTLHLSSYFENSAKFAQLVEPQNNQSFVSLSPLETLKKVSGRLMGFLHGREKVEEPRRRLLVVDDEESICFSMQEYFTHHG